MHIWGAPPLVWAHWANKLGLAEHLLPVVSNPAATISPDSKMEALGKTPSDYNFRRQARGIAKWTQNVSSAQQIERWASEPDYGICVQTRALRAIDIDVDNPRRAQRIVTHIERTLPWHIFPVRSRPDSGKVLLPFLFDGPLTKRVIPVDDGIVEFLGDGQQFIAYGTHPSGQRYTWGDELPSAFPKLDIDDLDTLWESLCTAFLKAGEQPRIARERREIKDMDLPAVDDPVANWLIANWEVHDHGADGQLYCACPFRDEHTSDTGATSTAYFPAGTGGYEQGHWSCLHAHCAGRADEDFNEGTGYIRSLFPDLTSQGAGADVDMDGDALVAGADSGGGALVEQRQWPRLTRSKDGSIDATARNLLAVIEREDVIGWWIAYDAFTDAMVRADGSIPLRQAQWQEFRDADYVDVRIRLEEKGFKAFGREMLRDVVHRVAHGRTIDVAQNWLTRQEWDGVARLPSFMHKYMGAVDDVYAEQVGLYAWTAMAGRVMAPGCQADMAVILVGHQGAYKSSAVKAMAPTPSMYTTISLAHRDADQSRKLRGKLVGELEELKGLQSREDEDIKAWITKTHEAWVPKFKEFETTFARRLVFWGTYNGGQFLADPTGARRFLPINVAETGALWGSWTDPRTGETYEGWQCDREAIAADRGQLWAEALHRWGQGGVQWREAEMLAKGEHDQFTVVDEWHDAVAVWLRTEGIDGVKPSETPFGLSTSEVAVAAIGIPLSAMDRLKERRVASVLKRLGYERRKILQKDGTRAWRYAK